MQDYRFIIIYESETQVYSVTGYIRKKGVWIQDGYTAFYSRFNEVLTYLNAVKGDTVQLDPPNEVK